MTHAQAIHQIRMAGYHDNKTYTPPCRISPRIFNQAFRDGQMLRAKGVRCGCNICEPKSI